MKIKKLVQKKHSFPIYLDFQSTTPIDPRVANTMQPYLEKYFGNPHSLHSHGKKSSQAVELAREKVASLINCLNNEIIFTSGATESNNLAILGLRALKDEGRNQVITVKTEHKCVLGAASELKRLGFIVHHLNVEI